jgi:hypothetical protein
MPVSSSHAPAQREGVKPGARQSRSSPPGPVWPAGAPGGPPRRLVHGRLRGAARSAPPQPAARAGARGRDVRRGGVGWGPVLVACWARDSPDRRARDGAHAFCQPARARPARPAPPRAVPHLLGSRSAPCRRGTRRCRCRAPRRRARRRRGTRATARRPAAAATAGRGKPHTTLPLRRNTADPAPGRGPRGGAQGARSPRPSAASGQRVAGETASG